MDHLTIGGPHIIVVVIDLDQARTGQNAVNVVVQASIFGNDAVLHRARSRRIDHLSVTVERVLPDRHQAIGSCDPVGLSMDHLAGGSPYIVVVSTDPDQARSGQDAVNIVVEAAVFRNDAVFLFLLLREDDSALVVEVVDALLQQTVCLGDPVGPIPHKRSRRGAGVIVIAVNLHQTIRNDHAVHAIVVVVGRLIMVDAVGASGKMHDHAVCIEGIVVSFRQCKSIVFLNNIFFRFCGRLICLAVFTEVIIVDLAVFLDNALQTGFFFDDAAVEPIGVRSDAVNTGNVALEHAFRIKDAACCFRRSGGDQRHDAGGSISGFGVQIVGIAVNDCPTGLLQLAILVVLLTVRIRKPAVVMLPAGLEGQIGKSKQF